MKSSLRADFGRDESVNYVKTDCRQDPDSLYVVCVRGLRPRGENDLFKPYHLLMQTHLIDREHRS